MKRTLLAELGDHLGQVVEITGFVESVRSLKKRQFLVVRDHSDAVQIYHERGDESDSLAATIDQITPGSTVIVKGMLNANDYVKLRGMELTPESITIDTLADTPLPIEPDSSIDSRLSWRFLDLRQPKNFLMFQVETALEHAMREYWMQNGFIEIHSPKLMGCASESGAELFEVKYFDRPGYLAQSPQFYKQMAMAAGFNKVFEIAPAFRADPSFTTRHATEFTSVDIEMSWIDSHDDVMKFEENWLHYSLSKVKEQFGDAIKEQFGVGVIVPELPFPRIPMAECYKILSATGHAIKEGDDLDPEGERKIAEYVQEKFGHEFVFVTDYPVSVRPFYHMRYADKPNTTKSFDLLWKGVEITTGAQREHHLEKLKAQALEKGVDLESIQYYLDFFKYGMPPHGGIGFGLSRMLMQLLGLPNIREASYLFRGPHRLLP